MVANCDTPPPTSLDVLAVADGAGLDEALLRGALADVVVDRERAAGRDHRAADDVGDAVDVRDPGLAGGVVGGEAGAAVVGAPLRQALLPPTGSLMP